MLFTIRFFLIASVLLISRNCFSQNCACPLTKERIYIKKTFSDSLVLCGYEYDSFGKDKIIGEFTFRFCKRDTILIDQFHNEAASFLFQPMQYGFLVTNINLQIENKRYIYPKTFEQLKIIVSGDKVKIEEADTNADSIVLYLKKNFKKTGELY